MSELLTLLCRGCQGCGARLSICPYDSPDHATPAPSVRLGSICRLQGPSPPAMVAARCICTESPVSLVLLCLDHATACRVQQRLQYSGQGRAPYTLAWDTTCFGYVHRELPAAGTALFTLKYRAHLLSMTWPAKPPSKNSVNRDAALLALSSESVLAWRNSSIRFSLASGLYVGPAGQHCNVSEGSLEGQ